MSTFARDDILDAIDHFDDHTGFMVGERMVLAGGRYQRLSIFGPFGASALRVEVVDAMNFAMLEALSDPEIQAALKARAKQALQKYLQEITKQLMAGMHRYVREDE